MRALLIRALQVIRSLVDGDVCQYAWRFDSRSPKGETCREFKTREQGVPMPGCAYCEARSFIKEAEEYLSVNH